MRVEGAAADLPTALAFQAEARRLWHIEEDKGTWSLTTVQGLIVIGMVYQDLGRDEQGLAMQAAATQMAYDLGLVKNTRSDGDDELFRSQQFTVWGLFRIYK